MGLLDFISPQDEGQRQRNIAFFQQLAQAGAPQVTPNSWALGLANGFGEGNKAQLAYQRFAQNQSLLGQDQQINQMRIDAARQEAERKKRIDLAKSNAFSAMPQQSGMPIHERFATMGQALMGSPETMDEAASMYEQAARFMPKPPSPIHLKEGEQLLDPSTYKPLANAGFTKPIDGYLIPDGAGGWKVDPSLYDAALKLKATGAPRTSVNVNSPYEPQFQKEIAGLDAKQLDKYRTQSESARAMLGTLDRLEKLSPNVYEAGGANAKLATANFLQGMGINVDPAKLANSSEFNALSSKLVLDSLGGTLGAGVSNADVAFLQQTVPNIGQSKDARQQLINFMRNKAHQQMGQFDDAYGYAVKNRGMMGYNPNQRFPQQKDLPDQEKQPAATGNNLSQADIDASLKNARNAILRNPSQRAEIIRRLEQNGITNHGLR